MTYNAKVAGSPLFVLRTSRSISCPWRVTLGPQKNFLRCLHVGDGAVMGLFLLPDTSAFQELRVDRAISSVFAQLLLPSPQLHSPVAVALLPGVLTLLLQVLRVLLRCCPLTPGVLQLLPFPAVKASMFRYSIESNLDGGFDVDLARNPSRPLS